MKKKIINIIPYIIGIIYLAYCLCNVEVWVKRHMEEHFLFIFIAWFLAVIFACVSIVLWLVKKQSLKMNLPVFFFVIGLIIDIVARKIPCCIGG